MTLFITPPFVVFQKEQVLKMAGMESLLRSLTILLKGMVAA
jgi:hypothetical protein